MARPRNGALTKKEAGFVKDYVRTGHGTQSALNNYDTKSPTVANAIATENLQKPLIQKAIKSIADRIPDNLLVKVHLEGLKANKTFIAGEEAITEPDYSVRHKYLESGYKIKGLDKTGQISNNTLIVNVENRNRMEGIANETASKLLDDEIV